MSKKLRFKNLLNKLPQDTFAKRHLVFAFATLGVVLVASVIVASLLPDTKSTNAQVAAVQSLNDKLLPTVSKYYDATDGSSKVELLQQAEAIAAEREGKMEKVIQQHPELASQAAIPSSVRSQLPPSVQAHIETAATVTGELQAYHADGFKKSHGAGEYQFVVRGKSDTVRIHRPEKDDVSLVKKAHSTVTVSGLVLNDQMAVSSGSSIQTNLSSTTSAVTSPGQRKVAVLLFNFSNTSPSQASPYTVDDARNMVFTSKYSVANYYRESTFSTITMGGKADVANGDVYGWYTIANDDTTCDPYAWSTAAKAQAQQAGVDLSGYDNVIMMFPQASSCFWAGLGEVNGGNSWINGAGAFKMEFPIIHEFGHNLGLLHSNGRECLDAGGQRVMYSDTCTDKAYYDPYDPMGNLSDFHFSVYHKGQLGVLKASNTQTVTQSGTYTIVPEDRPSDGVMALRIPKGDKYYYLEIRSAGADDFDGFGASYPMNEGVSIRLAPDYSQLDDSYIYDGSPENTSAYDRTLKAGNTFVDTDLGLSVKVLSVDPTAGATVQVSTDGTIPSDTTPPTGPINLTATSDIDSTNDTPYVQLYFTPSTDNVGVAGYDVYRDNQLVTTGLSSPYEGYIIDRGVAFGTTHQYYVQARDAAGNLSEKSNITQVTVVSAPSDTQPPTAPTKLSADSVQSTQVNLSWQASTDNVRVSQYVVYRGGSVVATSNTTSFGDATVNPNTSYTYTVKAQDAAGNLSAASNSVTVTTPSDSGGSTSGSGKNGNGGGKNSGGSTSSDPGGVAGVIRAIVRSRGTKQLVPVAGANVSISVKNGSVVQSTTTDGSGGYLFSGLKPGTYQLLVTAPGFHDGKTFVDVISGKVILLDMDIR